MRKRIALIMTALVMLIWLSKGNVGVDVVSAEEYEKNINLSIESKDIDINEIPENRKVELLVSIENNPGIRAMLLTIKFDSILNDPDWEYTKPLNGENHEDNEIWPSFVSVLESGEVELQLDADFRTSFFSKDGPLIYLVFTIPREAKVGDVYEIDFVRENINRSGLMFAPDKIHTYSSEYFDKLNSGVIRIVGNQAEETQIVPSVTNEENIQSSSNSVHENTIDPKETEAVINETVPSITVPVTVSTTASTTTYSSVESTSSPVTSIGMYSETTKPETVISTVSATVTDRVTTEYADKDDNKDDNEDKKEKKQGFPVIIIVAVLAAAVVLGIIKSRSKK